MDFEEQSQSYWSSPATFVIAAAGAVIGLGNVWRLPYLAGEYGGGAFLAVYAAALAAMALPLLIAELVLGRGARADLVTMLRRWARRAGLSSNWAWLGYLPLLGAVAVLSYYSVIAGWSMAYVMRAAGGALSPDAQALHGEFLSLVGDPEKGLGWHTIFMIVATVCVAQGLRRGIEPAARWALAAAFLLVATLVTATALGDGAGPALRYLLAPDFSALGWRGVAEALHQAFFTLSLGVGVMLAFGVYLPDEAPLWRIGAAVVALDTVFALAAGFAVTAMLFAADVSPAAGLKLIFEAVPATVGEPLGGWLVVSFFLMLVLVSLTSAIGLMEPLVFWVVRRFRKTRGRASALTGLGVWFVGLGTLLSFNLLADATLLDRTVFDWLSQLSGRLLLPVVGLLLCVFVGRFLPGTLLTEHWSGPPGRDFRLWRWLLRYPSRIGLLLVLLYSVGVFTFVDNLW